MKLKIVQFKDGKYGVYKGILFWKEFLDTDIEYDNSTGDGPWHTIDELIDKYCKFKTIEDARDARDRYVEKITKDANKNKFKVIE